MDSPPLLSPPPPCSGAYGANCYYPHFRFYEGLIFLTPILFTIIMIMVLCSVYFRRQRDRGLVSRSLRSVSSRNPFLCAPMPSGLDKAVRESFNTFTYGDKSCLPIIKGDEQCAVCLGDYQQNERLKQLPGCLHAFHAACIDLWLESNTTCPLCRVSLLPQPLLSQAASPSTGPATVLDIPHNAETSTGSNSLQTANHLASTSSAGENRELVRNTEPANTSSGPPGVELIGQSIASTSYSVVVDMPVPALAPSPDENSSDPLIPSTLKSEGAATNPQRWGLGKAVGSSSPLGHDSDLADIETHSARPAR